MIRNFIPEDTESDGLGGKVDMCIYLSPRTGVPHGRIWSPFWEKQDHNSIMVWKLENKSYWVFDQLLLRKINILI